MKNEKDEMSEIFDTKLLDISIKKARRKTRRRIIVISIMVFIIGNLVNTGISIIWANKMADRMDIEIETSIPSGYISKQEDNIGFLGGRSEYSIAKLINNRPVIIENESSRFGIINNIYITRIQGMESHNANEWADYYWENGYKKMLFFHPKLEYKAYKNDLSLLENLSEMEIVEVGLSFDKGYSADEVGILLKDFNVSWVWVDNYSEEKINELKQEIEEYGSARCYIVEGDTFGTFIRDGNILNEFESHYNRNLDELKMHSPKIYEAMSRAGLDKIENVKIIGATVQGTPRELKALSQVEAIKGATIGCVVNAY